MAETEKKYQGVNLEVYLFVQTHLILEHRYFLSQKMKGDVGFNFAFDNWIKEGHSEGYKNHYYANMSDIERRCFEIIPGKKIKMSELSEDKLVLPIEKIRYIIDGKRNSSPRHSL